MTVAVVLATRLTPKCVWAGARWGCWLCGGGSLWRGCAFRGVVVPEVLVAGAAPKLVAARCVGRCGRRRCRGRRARACRGAAAGFAAGFAAAHLVAPERADHAREEEYQEDFQAREAPADRLVASAVEVSPRRRAGPLLPSSWGRRGLFIVEIVFGCHWVDYQVASCESNRTRRAASLSFV